MIDQIATNNINNLITEISEQCIIQTAKRFNLSDIVLRAILQVEGGKPGEIRVNDNGSYDIGPMQINSIWLDKFNSYTSLDKLLYNGCINLQVGAWILKNNINQANGDLWQGIGNYHSTTPKNHMKYREKIKLAAQKIKQEYKLSTKS